MSKPVRRRSIRGLSVVHLLVAMMAIFMMSIFGLDIGLLYRTAARAKSASDAAALAAAARLMEGMEVASAASELIVSEHLGPNGNLVILVTPENGPGTELEFGRWNPDAKSFEPTTVSPNAVRATITLNKNHPNGAVPVFLGGLFNLPYTSMSRQSIAQIRVRPGALPMLLLRSPMGSGSLTMDGDASIRAFHSSIDVASNSLEAARLTDNCFIEAIELTVNGDVALGTNAQIDAALLTGTQPAEDPFDGMPIPSSSDAQIRTPVPETPDAVALPPGIYESGLQYTQGTYTLSNGFYFLRGNGLNLSGTARMIGIDSRIILEGVDATVSLSENAMLNISKEPTYPMQGNMTLIAVDTTSDWIIQDSSTLSIAGSVYAPSTTVDFQNGNWIANATILKNLHMNHDSAMDLTGIGLQQAQARRSGAVLVR